MQHRNTARLMTRLCTGPAVSQAGNRAVHHTPSTRLRTPEPTLPSSYLTTDPLVPSAPPLIPRPHHPRQVQRARPTAAGHNSRAGHRQQPRLLCILPTRVAALLTCGLVAAAQEPADGAAQHTLSLLSCSASFQRVHRAVGSIVAKDVGPGPEGSLPNVATRRSASRLPHHGVTGGAGGGGAGGLRTRHA